MPIYEYEPTEHDCLMCPNRIEVLQGLDESPLEYCPGCGLPVKRVISRATFARHATKVDFEAAARRGFTTFRRSGAGTWEKVAGDGVDAIVGSPEDQAAVAAEKAPPPPVLDLDADV